MNSYILKGREIAKSCYSIQRYFNQLILLCEMVANLLLDKGWEIHSWYKGQPVDVWQWNWADDRSFLPKRIGVNFKESNGIEDYRFSLWFFNKDPESDYAWIPFGYFSSIKAANEKEVQWWLIEPIIADFLRPHIVAPMNKKSVFFNFKNRELPAEFDNVKEQIAHIKIIPFPLTCIDNSEHLEHIVNTAIQALRSESPDILLANKQYCDLIRIQDEF